MRSGSARSPREPTVTSSRPSHRTIEQSSAEEAGRVIRQSPEGGSEQPKGSTVTLVVSTGPEQQEQPEPSEPAVTIDVPDVTGLAAEDAATALEQAGLQVGTVSEQSSDTVSAGAVISSDPAAGEQVPEQAPVDLVVSTGPEATGDGAADDAPGNSGGNGNSGSNGNGNADEDGGAPANLSLRRR